MVMSPLDLRNQEFHKAFRGYSEDEVDSFLEVIRGDYETIFRENLDLKDQLSQKDESMWKYRDIEETLKSTLVLAQKTAEEVRNSSEKEAKAVLTNANREAELVLKEGAREAEMLIKEARDKARSIVGEYAGLQKQAEMFKANLRATLQAQLDMLQDHSAVKETAAIQQAVAATLVGEPEAFERELSADSLSANVSKVNFPADNISSNDVSANNISTNNVSEDTIAFEAIKNPQDLLLKEPRYNPGNPIE